MNAISLLPHILVYIAIITSCYNIDAFQYNVRSLPCSQDNMMAIRRRISYSCSSSSIDTKTKQLILLQAFRGSDDYKFKRDDDNDEEDDDDKPPDLSTSPQEFLYRMQQLEKRTNNSDSSSSDNNDINDILPAAAVPTSGPGRGGRSTPPIRPSAFGSANKNKQSSSLSNTIKNGAKGGNTSDNMTKVYICTNCGAEYLQWMGRCGACMEWNTIQEHMGSSKNKGGKKKRDNGLGSSSQGMMSSRSTFQKSGNSWLDGIDYDNYNNNLGGGGGASSFNGGGPVRVTDVYQEILSNSNSDDIDWESAFKNGSRERRILVPNDDEMNSVLGGGIMPGSICLVGGDPGTWIDAFPISTSLYDLYIMIMSSYTILLCVCVLL